MKFIVCKVCQNTSFHKEDNLIVCNSCGTKYPLEIAFGMVTEKNDSETTAIIPKTDNVNTKKKKSRILMRLLSILLVLLMMCVGVVYYVNNIYLTPDEIYISNLIDDYTKYFKNKNDYFRLRENSYIIMTSNKDKVALIYAYENNAYGYPSESAIVYYNGIYIYDTIDENYYDNLSSDVKEKLDTVVDTLDVLNRQSETSKYNPEYPNRTKVDCSKIARLKNIEIVSD